MKALEACADCCICFHMFCNFSFHVFVNFSASISTPRAALLNLAGTWSSVRTLLEKVHPPTH